MKPKLGFRSFSLNNQDKLKLNPLDPIHKASQLKVDKGIQLSILDINADH